MSSTACSSPPPLRAAQNRVEVDEREEARSAATTAAGPRSAAEACFSKSCTRWSSHVDLQYSARLPHEAGLLTRHALASTSPAGARGRVVLTAHRTGIGDASCRRSVRGQRASRSVDACSTKVVVKQGDAEIEPQRHAGPPVRPRGPANKIASYKALSNTTTCASTSMRRVHEEERRGGDRAPTSSCCARPACFGVMRRHEAARRSSQVCWSKGRVLRQERPAQHIQAAIRLRATVIALDGGAAAQAPACVGQAPTSGLFGCAASPPAAAASSACRERLIYVCDVDRTLAPQRRVGVLETLALARCTVSNADLWDAYEAQRRRHSAPSSSPLAARSTRLRMDASPRGRLTPPMPSRSYGGVRCRRGGAAFLRAAKHPTRPVARLLKTDVEAGGRLSESPRGGPRSTTSSDRTSEPRQGRRDRPPPRPRPPRPVSPADSSGSFRL